MPVFNQDPKIKRSVASWDDLPDRPFGEFVTECGETLAWDGTPTATAVSIGDITYYRVSESTPTIEELTGGSMNSVLGENTYPVSLKAEDFEQHNEHVIFCNAFDGTPFIVVNEDDAVAEMNGETLTFAKKGIYFILTSYGVYVKDLTVTGYNFTKVEIKKIDKAYLSEALPEVSEEDDDKSLFVEKGKWVAKYPNIIYDGKVNTEYGASTSRAKGELDTVLSLIEGNTYKVVYDGEAYDCVCSVKSAGDGQDYLCLGNANFVASAIESTGEPFCVLLGDTRTTLHCGEEGEHTLLIAGEKATDGGVDIITADSVDELPDPSTVKPGTVALIPSVAQSVYVYDSLDAAAAANLPEGSLVAVPSTGYTKIIDLTKYAFDDGVTFNDKIMSLFLTEGGQVDGVDNTTFWDDLNTDKALMFLFDGSAMKEGQTLECPIVDVMKESGTPTNVCFSFIIYATTFQKITIFIVRGMSDGKTMTTIYFAMETVSIPTT